MAYPQDLVGKFIDYRVDQGIAIPLRKLAGMVVRDVLTGRVAEASAAVYEYFPGRPGLGSTPPVPARWVNTNMDWSFVFLQYVAGAVTVASRQKSVLTGPMSGCFLFKYRDGGPEKIAHVGTANAPDSEETKTAKQSWQSVARQRQVSEMAGASPYNVFQFDEISGAVLATGYIPMVAGYFDSAGPAYSMLLSPVPPAMNPPVTPMLKVSAVKRMALSSWNTVRNLKEFRS